MLHRRVSILFLLMAVLAWNHVSGHYASLPSIPRGQVSNVTAVYGNILNGYDRRKRPFYNVKPEEINVGVYVVSISHISEENMEFQADIYLHQIWRDRRLAFGDANESILLQGEDVNLIWLPDLYISNARQSVIDRELISVLITGGGEVYYSARMRLTLAAFMDLRNYPMDEQNLKFTLMSYIHTTDMFNILWFPTLFSSRELPTFSLLSSTFKNTTNTYITGTFQDLTLSIRAKRRLGYFLVQFYFPCGVCTIISWIPFYMDRYETGDRMMLSITTLLTEMFLSQYINSSMPQVSYVKASDQYILVSFLLIFFALLENILMYWNREDVQREKHKPKKMTVCAGEIKENEVALSTLAVIDDSNGHEHQATIGQEPSNENSSSPPTRKKDMSKCIDHAARIAFPLVYGLFIVVYFAWGLTYYTD